MANWTSAQPLDPVADDESENEDSIIAIQRQLTKLDEQVEKERSAFCNMYTAAFLVDASQARHVAARLEREGTRADDLPFLVAYAKKYKEYVITRAGIEASCPVASTILASFPAGKPSRLPSEDTVTVKDLLSELKYQRKVTEMLIAELHRTRVELRETVYETTFPLTAHGNTFSVNWHAVFVPQLLLKSSIPSQEPCCEATIKMQITSRDSSVQFYVYNKYSRGCVNMASATVTSQVHATPFRVSDVVFCRYVEEEKPQDEGCFVTLPSGDSRQSHVRTATVEKILIKNKKTSLPLCCIAIKLSKVQHRQGNSPPRIEWTCFCPKITDEVKSEIIESWEIADSASTGPA